MAVSLISRAASSVLGMLQACTCGWRVRLTVKIDFISDGSSRRRARRSQRHARAQGESKTGAQPGKLAASRAWGAAAARALERAPGRGAEAGAGCDAVVDEAPRDVRARLVPGVRRAWRGRDRDGRGRSELRGLHLRPR